MVLSGIVLSDNNIIGIEIYYNKNIIFLLRKISYEILLFFKNIHTMTRFIDNVEQINNLIFYDKFIENIILNNNINKKKN